MSFSEIVKNLLLVVFIVSLAPTVLKLVKTQYENILEPKTKVALLTLEGTISSSTNLIKSLKKYFEDKDIKAIVLKIDSPGGSAGSSQDIFGVIKSLKEEYKKPIISFVENMAASGGYYVASATDYIIATPAAFIGSIGSYIGLISAKKFIEQFNLKYEFIKSGEYKTAGNPFSDLTQEQRKMLQDLSDNVYQQFVSDIAEQRKLSKDPKIWAEGQIFTGDQAIKLGLIDEVGSHTNVVKALKTKAGIEGKIDWVKPTKATNVLYSLLTGDEETSGPEFKSLINRIYNEVKQNCMQEQIQANF